MPYLKNSQKPQLLDLLEEPHPEEALVVGQLAAALCDIQPSLALHSTGFIRLPASDCFCPTASHGWPHEVCDILILIYPKGYFVLDIK